MAWHVQCGCNQSSLAIASNGWVLVLGLTTHTTIWFENMANSHEASGLFHCNGSQLIDKSDQHVSLHRHLSGPDWHTLRSPQPTEGSGHMPGLPEGCVPWGHVHCHGRQELNMAGSSLLQQGWMIEDVTPKALTPYPNQRHRLALLGWVIGCCRGKAS